MDIDFKESPMHSLEKMENYQFYVNANHAVLKKEQNPGNNEDVIMQSNKDNNPNYDFSSVSGKQKDLSPN